MARAIKINSAGTMVSVAKIYINDSGSMVKVKKGYINSNGTMVQFYGAGPFVDLDPELTITQSTATNPKEYSRSNKPTLTGKTYYLYNTISATGCFEFSDTKTDSVAGTTWITNSVSGQSKFGSHNITLPTSTNPSVSAGYFTSPGFVWDQDDYPFETTPSYFRYVVEATDAEDNVNTFTSIEKPIISKPMVYSGTLKVKKTLTDRYDYDNTGTELFTTEWSITGYSYEWTIRSSTSVTSSANILAGTTVSGTITGATPSLSDIPQYDTSTYGDNRYGKYAVLRVWATNSAGTDLTEYFSAASDKLYAPVGTVSYSGTGFSQSLSKVSYMGTYTITLNNDWVAPVGTTYRYTWYRTASIAGSADVVVQAGTYGSSTTSSLTINGSNGVIGEFYYCMVDTNTSLFLETIKAQLTPPAPTVSFQSNTTGGAKNFYVVIGNGASYPGYEGTTQNIRWFGSWNSTGSNGTLSGTIPYPSNDIKPLYTQTYPLYVTATGTIPNWVGSNSVSITGVTSTLVTTGLNPTTVSSWETGSASGTIWFPYVGTVSVSGGNTAITQKRISKGSSLVVSTSGGTTISPGGATVVYTYQWYELNDSSTVVYTGATFTPNESSYMGKQYRCKVTAALGDLTDIAYTDYYMVVPGAPSFTLSQNGQGSFSTSTIVSNGATHYNGTYTYGSTTNTLGNTPIASSVGPVIVGKTTVSMTLYGQYYNGSIYIDGYATTTQSISVLAAPAATSESIPEISRQQDYNYVYTTTNGSWLYSPTSYAYAWKYSTDGGASFTTIAQTTQTITLDASYIGRKLYCTITATNSDGSGSTTTSNIMAFLVTGAYPAPFSISSIVDSTPTPVTPSSVVISSNSSNVGTLTWTSLLTSVDSFNWVLSGTPFASSGSVAAVAGQGTYTYGSWTFSVDGNESASVTAVNNNPRVDVNWETSTNATSYNLTYTTSGGQTTVNGITNTYYPVYVASGTGLIVNSLKAVNTYLPTGRATTTSVPTTSVNAVPKSGTAATATALLLAYPQSSVAPVISRTSIDGYVYTCTTGTWTATTGVTYSYQWLSGGNPITFGGNSSTLNASNAYIGSSLTCIVTATNSNTRSNSRTSAAVTVTVARPGPFTYSLSPAAVTPGTPTGLTLSSNSSNQGILSWTSGGGSSDYSYVLSGTPFSETSSTTNGNTSINFTIVGSGTETASVAGKIGSQGVNITWGSSSDASSYTLSYTDNSGTVHNVAPFSASGTYTIPYPSVQAVTLTATNTSGSRSATTSDTFPYVTGTVTGTSATTSATLNLYPQSSVAPVITRTSIDGYTYSCSTGTWTATEGVTYSYQWYINSNPITTAGTSTYTTNNSSIGSSLTCEVTATNSNTKFNSRTSSAVTVTIARPGAFTYSLSSNAITPGTPTGLTLSSNSSNQGTFSWTAVSGASDYTYTLSGTPFTESSSTTFGNITIPFTVIASGTETGTVAAKASASGISITWGASSDAATYTLSYTDNSGTVHNVAPFNAAGSYTIPYATVQAVTLTATNAAGSRAATTSNTLPYTALNATGTSASISTNLLLYPQNSVIPAITRVYPHAYAYTCSTGTWTATSGVSYAYQWYVNGNAQGVNNGGTTATIGLDSSNIGGSIYCVVTATNTNGGSKTAQANGLTVTGATPQPFTFSLSDSTLTPSVPSITSMTVNSSNTITLNWNAATNATDYEYSFSGTGSGSSTTTFNTLSGTGTLASTGSVTGQVRAKRGQTGVQVNWTTSTYASSYTVNYTAGGTTYNQTGLTGNSWNTGFANVTVNSVTAVNSYGSTGSSSSAQSGSSATQYSSYASTTSTLTYTAPLPLPGTPTSLTATTTSPAGVTLTFSGSSNASSYDVFWNSYAAGTPSAGTAADYPTVTSPWSDPGISQGNTRYYWVRGKNATGTSAWYPAGNGVIGTRPFPTLYTVTFSGNGQTFGTPSVSSVTQGSEGAAVTLATVGSMGKTGYTFGGWTIGGSSYASGASYTPTANVTASAIWNVASSAPSTPTGLSNSYTSGPTWTGSWTASTGTGTITYYWTLYQSSSNGGTINATATGSTTGTTFTQSMSSANGLWAYFTVYASNTSGNSGTVTSGWA